MAVSVRLQTSRESWEMGRITDIRNREIPRWAAPVEVLTMSPDYWICFSPGKRIPYVWNRANIWSETRPPSKGLPVGSVFPNLSDPVTAAALLVLAREVSRDPGAAAMDDQLSHKWQVWSSYSDTLTPDDDRGRPMKYETEVEALAAVILRGGK